MLIIEAKKSSIGEAFKQCMLSMRDMRDGNGSGIVYGSCTTGESWQMLRYDGLSFVVTDKFDAIFRSMRGQEEQWIKGYSLVVDCLEMVLLHGGIRNNTG